MFERLSAELLATLLDVAPIVVVILAFQTGLLRRRPANPRRILVGSMHVVLGLTLFRIGINDSLLPMGDLMARQLVSRGIESLSPYGYLWLYLFAAVIGFAAALIEPTLTAVAERVRDMSGGAIRPWSLRIAVGIGVAAGLTLGTVRIVLGFPFEYIVVPAIMLIAALSFTAPRTIVPLALDSGAMATSAVVVPLIAAFGIALADAVPGRDPLADGFGLVVLALLAPMVSLLGFTQMTGRRREPPGKGDQVCDSS